jgi:hypothetical protein
MPDGILDLIDSVRAGTAASVPAVVPDVPRPGETPQQATLRSIAAARNASAPNNSAAMLSMLDQATQGKLPAPANGVPSDKLTGPIANFGAGANEVIAGTLGLPVNLATGVINNFATPARAARFFAGEGNPPLITKPVGGSTSIEQGMGLIGADPRNVVPSDSLDSLARSAGGGTAAMLLPVGGIPESGTALARQGLIGGIAGVGGNVAAANVPAPYKPLANAVGQLAGGGVAALGDAGISATARAGANLARPLLAPFSENAAKDIAASRLQAATTNLPVAVSTASHGLEEPPLVRRSEPTLGQLTGDSGLLALERTQATKNPDLFKTRQAEQQEAQVGALNGVQPTGSPAAVGAFIRQQLDAMDTRQVSAIAGAQARAGEANTGLGGFGTAQEYGQTIRSNLAEAQRAAKANEARLWDAIDPTGNLTIDARPTAQAAQQILGEIPETAAKPSGEEAQILATAQGLGGNTSFRNLSALKSRVGDELRAQRFNAGSPTLIRRLAMLQDAISQNIADGAEGVAQREQQAVAAGQMSPEDAMTARLAALAQQHYSAQNVRAPAAIAEMAAGRTLGAGPSGVSGSGSPMAFGSDRTGLSPSGRFGSASRDQSLSNRTASQVAPTFDTAAAARYRAAANATRERVGTFNKGAVGQVLRQGENAGTFRLPDSAVAAKFFNKGTHAAEDVQGFQNAAGGRDEAEAALREYAALDLRRAASRPDGTLDPLKMQQWLAQHRDALKAFPELSDRFGQAAEAQRVVDNMTANQADVLRDRQRFSASRFIGSDPVLAFGSALKAKNPASEMTKLARWASLDKTGEAPEGLRRAAVEYMQQRFLSEATGNPALKAQQFHNFLRQNREALGAVLGQERMKQLDNIAADLQRTNAVRAKLPGPGTAQDLTGVRKTAHAAGEGRGENLLAYLIGLGAEHVTGNIVTSLALALGVKGASMLRAAGLRTADDLVTEGLLNPEVGRMLLMRVTPSNRSQIAARLAGQLRKLSVAVPLATATGHAA